LALTPDRPREPGLSSVLRLVPPLRIERRPPALQAGAQTHYARAALLPSSWSRGQGSNLHSPEAAHLQSARLTHAQPLDKNDNLRSPPPTGAAQEGARSPSSTTLKSASPCQRATPHRLASTLRAVSIAAVAATQAGCLSLLGRHMAERLLSRPRQAQPRRAQTKTPPSFGLRRARWGPRFKDLMRAELGHARTLRARCRGEGPIADLLAWQPITAMHTHPEPHVRDERGQAGGIG
jgi:hypothetical protein